jgi:hypothetical protein
MGTLLFGLIAGLMSALPGEFPIASGGTLEMRVHAAFPLWAFLDTFQQKVPGKGDLGAFHYATYPLG